jgi:hypothetical protein
VATLRLNQSVQHKITQYVNAPTAAPHTKAQSVLLAVLILLGLLLLLLLLLLPTTRQQLPYLLSRFC